MAQRETNNEDKAKYCDYDLEILNEVKTKLEERNKIICARNFEPLHEDDHSELSFDHDIDVPNLVKSEQLEKNEGDMNDLISTLEDLKYLSVKHTYYNEESGRVTKEGIYCYEMMEKQKDVKNQNANIFGKIKKIQTDFNNCFQKFSETLEDKSNVQNILDKHEKLVERTCMVENGIDKLFCCNVNFLKKNYKIDMKYDTDAEYVRASYNLGQGLLSSLYKKATKNVKNHPHLLDIKKSNELFVEKITVDDASSIILDPPAE